MKLTAFCLLSLFLFMDSFGQQEKKFTLALHDYVLTGKIALPFVAIKIVDARYDQKNIGCVVKNLSSVGITYQKMLAVFPEPIETYLPRVFGNFLVFDPTKKDTLLMLIKQMRIVDHVPNRVADYQPPASVLTLSCSFYKIDGNKVLRITSIDETMAEKWSVSAKPEKEQLTALRGNSISRLFLRVFENIAWIPSQQAFFLADMESAIQRRLQIPLFTDTVLPAGIYQNFEEFKNNAPSIKKVKFIRHKNGDVKEILSADSSVIDRTSFWGFSDGKDRYIVFQKGIHKLHSIDKSFRLRFYRRMSEASPIPSGNSTYSPAPGGGIGTMNIKGNVPDGTAYDARQEFLYLNFETGNVHVEEVIGTQPMRKFRGKSER